MVISIGLVAQVASAGCLDISGTYNKELHNNTLFVEKYIQTQCDKMNIITRRITQFGQQLDNNEFVSLLPLELCDRSSCTVGSATETQIYVDWKEATVIMTPNYGLCQHNAVTYTKAKNGALIKDISVYKCDDHFTGTVGLILDRN